MKFNVQYRSFFLMCDAVRFDEKNQRFKQTNKRETKTQPKLYKQLQNTNNDTTPVTTE